MCYCYYYLKLYIMCYTYSITKNKKLLIVAKVTNIIRYIKTMNTTTNRSKYYGMVVVICIYVVIVC